MSDDKPVINVSHATYAEIREKLIEQGSAGTIVERSTGLTIDCGEFVIRSDYKVVKK